jgi:hypothetical protein
MDEPPSRPGDPSNPTETALFVAATLTRLEKMARSAGLDQIAYFVSMAKLEADFRLGGRNERKPASPRPH